MAGKKALVRVKKMLWLSQRIKEEEAAWRLMKLTKCSPKVMSLKDHGAESLPEVSSLFGLLEQKYYKLYVPY